MKSIFLTFLYLTLFLLSNGQKTIVLQPGPADGQDGYINSAFPDYSWGNEAGLIACAWTFGGDFGIGRSLIRFDLSQVPAGAQILDARLTLCFDPGVAYGSQTGENASVLNKIVADWHENTVTWNSQPPVPTSDAIFIPKTQSTTQDLENINVTRFVEDWVLHPETNFGVILRMETEIEYCCLVLSSSDNFNGVKRPKLVVTYRDCPTPLANFTFVTQIPKVSFFDNSFSAFSWFWDFGDGYFSNLKNPEHLYSTQGIYNVCLQITDSCGADTICKSVAVCLMPEPHFNWKANSQTVTFRDSSSSPLSWFWSFGDGFFSDLKDPVHFFNESGTYYVCEEVTNGCGIQSYCDSVKIYSSAVENLTSGNDIKLYPNPARDVVKVIYSASSHTTVQFELFALPGFPLRNWTDEIKPGSAALTIDLGWLSPGAYLLQSKIDGVVRLNKLIIL